MLWSSSLRVILNWKCIIFTTPIVLHGYLLDCIASKLFAFMHAGLCKRINDHKLTRGESKQRRTHKKSHFCADFLAIRAWLRPFTHPVVERNWSHTPSSTVLPLMIFSPYITTFYILLMNQQERKRCPPNNECWRKRGLRWEEGQMWAWRENSGEGRDAEGLYLKGFFWTIRTCWSLLLTPQKGHVSFYGWCKVFAFIFRNLQISLINIKVIYIYASVIDFQVIK